MVRVILPPFYNPFLSTPSARRATSWPAYWATWTKISIHALREEGDLAGSIFSARMLVFLSTPSARRATFLDALADIDYKLFLSTPSARRATDQETADLDEPFISIHALREEGDL